MRTFAKVIIGINIIFLLWVVGGVGANADNCDGLSGDDLEICEAGTAIGTGIGVTLICGLWAIVDIILGVLYLITQPKPEPVVVYADRPPEGA
tara:strand:+ start:499 stop:777 length:279 start_codon:yes stop_codon:yes gene_type:complete